MTSPLHRSVPVTDAAELTERWRGLLQKMRAPDSRTLCLAWFLPDGTMAELVVPVDDIPVEPDRVMLGNLAQLTEVVAEHERVEPAELHLAFCLERRGPSYLTPDDQAWVAAIEAVLRGREGRDCSVHVAADTWVVPALPRVSW
ncbi:hypothetical protein [Klenkia brasiliensis]|uniref:Uncharacterized protein n=1 Tax=Klenkia brasiliensis TaxID=333142 RepID=A0A1G7TKL7_9ACTN|nr:hypothetical protein [Klenkia brasiliensis]SDG35219.1 hypothetical protein SAMN05660324_2496 [Klenkia brasiliensis]